MRSVPHVASAINCRYAIVRMAQMASDDQLLSIDDVNATGNRSYIIAASR